MYKRLIIFFVVFVVLCIFNVITIYSLENKTRRTAYNKQLLSEIEHAKDLYNPFNHSSSPLVLGTTTAEADFETADPRSINLRAFFRAYDSPLYPYADYIVTTADKYGMDYRIIPAIAMQESTLCKFIPPESYNCWGWGIYGDTITKFTSYEDAIDTVSKGLRDGYLDKGLVTASQIMEKYTPSSPQGAWAKGVNTALRWIEQ